MSVHSQTPSEGERPTRQTYGQPRFTAGFPACRLASTADSVQTTYASSLLSAGHGYPLFEPISTYSDDVHQDEVGLRLGDVGYLNGAGHFTSLFNIFQTKRTDQSSLPRKYEKINPAVPDWEPRCFSQYFPPGTIIASEGIKVKALTTSPLKIKISTNGARGAILALPDGASRQDIVDADALRPHVEQHALGWYQSANSSTRDPSRLYVRNGALYLITGVDIAPRWATAVIDDPTVTGFEYHGSDNEWYPVSGMSERNYPSLESTRGNIFIRGFSIALGSAIWAQYMPRLRPSQVSMYTLLTPCGDSDLPLLDRWKLKVRAWLSRRRGEDYSPDKQPAHPALVFLQAMLAQAPSANAIMVHDSIWSSTQGIDLQYPHLFDRIVEILDRHIVKVVDGVAILTPKDEGSPSQLNSATGLTRLAQIVFGKPRDDETRRLRRLELWRVVNHVDPIE